MSGQNGNVETLTAQIRTLEKEIRERGRVEQELRYRLKFETLIAGISTGFVKLGSEEIDRGIMDALEVAGKFLLADRAYLFLFSRDRKSITNTHEWCAPGVTSHRLRLQNLPYDHFPWLMKRIEAGEFVRISQTAALPPEACAEKMEFQTEGIESMILVPMITGRAVVGFIGCDSVGQERIWSEDVGPLLKIAGEAFAGALERKRVEEALRTSEEKYRNILENIEEGYFEVDLKGNMTFYNESVCRILGRTREEMAGLNNREYTSEENAKKLYRMFNLVFSTGKAVSVSDHEVITKGGGTRVMEMSISPVRDASGAIFGFRGIARDITERKRSEDILKESEERYRTVLEANPDPVVVYDIQGRVILFNPAFTRVFGWSLEECRGKKMDQFVPEETWHETRGMIRKVMTGESFSGIETTRFTRKKERIPVSISGAIYRDLNGNPLGSVINLRDISEQRKMESQLQYAQKMESIGTLAGGIAHDFNNLLMAAQGNVSLMLYGLDPDHPHFEGLSNIEKQIQSGAKLTRQLLGYARKGKYEVRPLDLNRLVEETAEAFGRTRKEITIRTDFSPACTIEGDQGQIEQVLLNLYVNAWQAMPRGGDLLLKTSQVHHGKMGGTLYRPKPGNYVLLQVTDTGTGMEPKTLSRVFEPFFTTKEMGRGTGLGLASAYGIVKGHGGYIEVDSRVGLGTTFRIYLPASRKNAAEPVMAPGGIHEGSGTILLVDDEEMVREIGLRLLTTLGYRVLLAGGGREAVEVVTKQGNEIDLVLLDMIMPEMGGSEVFDRVRNIAPQVKILLSSGYSMDGDAKEIMSRGCNGFIQKPYRLDDLSRKLREILSE